MPDDQGWEEYKTKFKKIYKSPEEEEMRRNLYLKRKISIDKKNENYRAQNDCTWVSLNKYADYKPKELSKVKVFSGCTGYFSPRLPDGRESPELPDIF